MLGRIISVLLIVSGVLLQTLVPIHKIDTSNLSLFGIPEQISAIWIGTILILFGLTGLYFFYYKEYAHKLNNKDEK